MQLLVYHTFEMHWMVSLFLSGTVICTCMLVISKDDVLRGLVLQLAQGSKSLCMDYPLFFLFLILVPVTFPFELCLSPYEYLFLQEVNLSHTQLA